jgi:hypothetical protein
MHPVFSERISLIEQEFLSAAQAFWNLSYPINRRVCFLKHVLVV